MNCAAFKAVKDHVCENFKQCECLNCSEEASVGGTGVCVNCGRSKEAHIKYENLKKLESAKKYKKQGGKKELKEKYIELLKEKYTTRKLISVGYFEEFDAIGFVRELEELFNKVE